MIMSYHLATLVYLPLPRGNMCRFLQPLVWGVDLGICAVFTNTGNPFMQLSSTICPKWHKTMKILIALIVVLLLVNSTKSFCFLNSNMCGSLNNIQSQRNSTTRAMRNHFTILHSLSLFMSIHVVPLQGCCSSKHIGEWIFDDDCHRNPFMRPTYFFTSWWFQPIWKILVKLDHFPR